MTIGEYRQKSTKKNARELLLLSDVMVPDMVVICDIGIIIGMEHVIKYRFTGISLRIECRDFLAVHPAGAYILSQNQCHPWFPPNGKPQMANTNKHSVTSE